MLEIILGELQLQLITQDNIRGTCLLLRFHNNCNLHFSFEHARARIFPGSKEMLSLLLTLFLQSLITMSMASRTCE